VWLKREATSEENAANAMENRCCNHCPTRQQIWCLIFVAGRTVADTRIFVARRIVAGTRTVVASRMFVVNDDSWRERQYESSPVHAERIYTGRFLALFQISFRRFRYRERMSGTPSRAAGVPEWELGWQSPFAIVAKRNRFVPLKSAQVTPSVFHGLRS